MRSMGCSMVAVLWLVLWRVMEVDLSFNLDGQSFSARSATCRNNEIHFA